MSCGHMNNDKVIKELLAFAEENKSVENYLFKQDLIEDLFGMMIFTIVPLIFSILVFIFTRGDMDG